MSYTKLVTLLRSALCLVSFITLNSCKEGQPSAVTPSPAASSTATQFRLKKAIRTGSTSTTTYIYSYNQAGQLANYTIRTGAAEGAPSQTTVFTYDQQGRLTSAERLPAPLFTTARLAYSYDDKGNISVITVNEDVDKNGQFRLAQTIALEYGTDKLPVKTTVTSGRRTETTRYTYDHGNAIKTEHTVNPGFSQVPIVQYRHDDKPNPTFGLLIGTPNAEMFNKNNIIYEGSEMTYSDGLLTLIHTNVKEPATVQSYIKYEYEVY